MSEFQISIEDLLRAETKILAEFNCNEIRSITETVKLKFNSFNKLAQSVGIDSSKMSDFLNKKHKLPLKFALKISEFLQMPSAKLISKVCTQNDRCFIPTDNFPIKASKELALLLGHAIGDGHINRDQFTFANGDKGVINSLIRSAEIIGIVNPNPRITIFPNNIVTDFPSLVGVIILLSGGVLGEKTIKEFKVPKWIKEGSREIKSAFIRALFDDDGSVKKNRSITLSFSKIEELQDNLVAFLKDIASFLEGFEIANPKIFIDKPWISKTGIKTIPRVLAITSTKNFINFQKHVGFSHAKKTHRLKEMIFNTKTIRFRNGEGQIKILEVLKSSPKDTKEISKLLNVNPWITRDHLRQMEDKNLIKRIRPNIKGESHLWMINNDTSNSSTLR